jgi:alpha-D-xyloside xylohydrolase
MRLQVCKDDIIRVQYTSAATIPSKISLSVSNSWEPPPVFCVSEAAGIVTIATGRIKAKVTTASGLVSYTDSADNVILGENSKSLTAVTVSGRNTNRVQAAFASPASEGLFGLGQHQDGVVNKKGTQVHFHNVNNNTRGSATQGGDYHDTLLVSNIGYGIFWDNAADGDFFGNDSNGTAYHFSSNAGDMVDYYFMYGPTIDQVIARTEPLPEPPRCSPSGRMGFSSRKTPTETRPSSWLSRTATVTPTFQSMSSSRIGTIGHRMARVHTS